MKKLKNLGIYYIILTIISIILSFMVGLYLFLPLLPFFILGIAFLLSYYITKKLQKKAFIKLPKGLLNALTIFLIILPFISYTLTMWYPDRPYKQHVILPANYEGVVAIQYNRPDGQEKIWTNGFLGFGASRLIKVYTTGIAKTKFKFHNTAIPLLGMEQYDYNDGGLKIYYENDLDNEIVEGADGSTYSTYKNKGKDKPNIYFTTFKKYPLIIFAISKSENYYKYFMSAEEKDILQKKYKENPYDNYPPDKHELNQKYKKYYELDFDYKELSKQ